MPLLRKTCENNTVMGLWHMTEELCDLESQYTVKEAERALYEGFRNDRRRKEWLTVRILLAELAGPDAEIMYRDSGKPYLKDSSLCISITHTIGYVGIRLGQHPVALDMEYKAPRVLNIIKKFVSEKEMCYIDPDDKITTALLLWSAKESLYKLFDFTDILFDQHLFISGLKVDGPQGTFFGTMQKDGFFAEVQLHYELLDDLILVYC